MQWSANLSIVKTIEWLLLLFFKNHLGMLLVFF